MRSKEEIFKRLNELTSYFSFGRVLGLMKLNESRGTALKQVQHSMESNCKRLMKTEIQLLAGLWLYNVNINKKWDFKDDLKFLVEIYELMNELHYTYKPTLNTSIYSTLKEIAFYEGDGAYNYQLIRFAKSKYDIKIFREILVREYNYNIDFINPTIKKIIDIIRIQIIKWKNANLSKTYVSPLNTFVIKPNQLHKHFLPEEIAIIKALSFNLGVEEACLIDDIASRNSFLQKPIIKLPNERGYFIFDLYSVFLAMSETPFYWISKSKNIKTIKAGDIRGHIAEKIVYDILLKKFAKNEIESGVIVKKSKSANPVTDIDLLLIHKDVCLIFQVKNKRITEAAKQGVKEVVERDFQKAVHDAYQQGKKSIECLRNSGEYYSFKKIAPSLRGVTQYYNVCIVLDPYPTLGSVCTLKFEDYMTENIPLIAMTAYDLDLVISLLDCEEVLEYILFRENCFKMAISGLSEVYFLGYFLNYKLGGPYYHSLYNNIPREYALIVDYIVDVCKEKRITVSSISDIEKVLQKYPLGTIQC